MKDIRISHIYKSFDEKEVLSDFSAVLKNGEITSLMAPSGSGKTTLLKLLTGLLKPDKGSIEGMDGLRLSVVFQEDRLLENLDAVGNIRLVTPSLTKKEAEEALCSVGLQDALHKKVTELSGGMKRRVSILRALLAQYDFLLMDEPFRGLDEETKKLVMDYTLEKVKGRTVLMITHDVSELDEMGIKERLTL